MQRAAYTAIKPVAPALTVISAPVVGSSAGTSATAAWDHIEVPQPERGYPAMRVYLTPVGARKWTA